MSDDMERAHRNDTRDERRMKDLLLVLKDFMDDPPYRCHTRTRGRIVLVMDAIEDDCARIVQVWN